jgi:hypothetical protein
MSRILPILLPVISLVILVFGAGVFITEYKIPPYRSITDGAKTLYYSFQALSAPPYLGQFLAVEKGVDAADAASARYHPGPEAEAFPETLLINGGLNEYRELCPEDGCLGLLMDRTGKVLHAYPYRPEAIFAADMTKGALHREAAPSDPRLVFRPLGLQLYDNGDLLVTFQSTGSMFPFAAGVARVDRDGNPVWFRFDYSHHWATLLPDGRALVPDLEVVEGNWVVPVGPRRRLVTLECHTGSPEVDGVHVIGPDGNVETRYDVAAALLESPWAPMLAETTDPCDPLHVNFVDTLDDTAPGGALSPGNLVISLRNLSAVAVMDPVSGKITKVMRGSYIQQHSVQQLVGSKVLMFDNWGGDAVGVGSRLLEVDLATGAERRVFPLPGSTALDEKLYSDRGSFLSISPDRRRVLVSFSGEGRGFEVDIASGKEILSYDSLHDLSGHPQASDAQKTTATRANLFGMLYVAP